MLLDVISFIGFGYHQNNFFHGDIKPDNIFFTKDFIDMTTDLGSLLYLENRNESE
jgi:serine/threonine protein kinase